MAKHHTESLTHLCANHVPNKHWFPHRRRGGNKFCSEKCRGEYFGRQSSLRKARERDRISRRQFLSTCIGGFVSGATGQAFRIMLESRSSTRTGRDEQIWTKINALDRTLVTTGPHVAAVRAQLLDGVRDVLDVIQADGTESAEETSIRARALAILRDIGLGVFNTGDGAELMATADEAVDLFEHLKDTPNLVRALLGAGNTARYLRDDKTAGKRFLYAYRLATERPLRSGDERLLQIRHQAAFWVLRTHRRGDVQKEAIREMEMALKETASLFIHLEHHRELIGYWTQQLHYDRAEEEIDSAENLRLQLSAAGARSNYDDPTFIKAEIELRLKRNRDLAIDLIRTRYSDAYRVNPHAYYARQLAQWRTEQRITLPAGLPLPDYGSPVLIYLPRFIATQS